MPRIKTLLSILVIVFVKTSIAQTTYIWQGGANGDYQAAANWGPLPRITPLNNDILAFDVTNPVAVSNVPTQTIGAIQLLAGTSSVSLGTNVAGSILTLNAPIPIIFTTPGSVLAADLLTISLGPATSFTMSSGTFGIGLSSGGRVAINGALTLAGGRLDFDVAGTGGVSVNAGGSITYNTGTFNCVNPSTIVWQNNSNYYHNSDGSFASAIPAGTWLGGSTCRITGMNAGTIVPTGLTAPINFAGFVWNCPSQSGDVNLNLSGNTFSISGLFSVQNTNNQYLNLAGTGGGIVIAGNYTQAAGNIRLQNANGATTLQVGGNFSHTGGLIDFVAGAGGGSATLDLKGTVTKNADWLCTATNTTAQMFVQFSGGTPQTVNIAGVWNDPVAGRCNINNSNADPAGVTLTGTLKVVNTNSAAAAVCVVKGIFSGTGSVVYSGTGAGLDNHILEYNGQSSQVPSVIEFPTISGPASLRVNNGVTVNFPVGFSRTLIGTLYLQTGNLNIRAGNTLSLTNPNLAAQLNYVDGYITSGTLIKRFPTSGLPTGIVNAGRFPFGSGSNDRSIYLYFSGANLTGASGGDIAISHTAVIDATTIATPFTDNTSLLNKRSNSSWNFNMGAFTLGSGGQSLSAIAYGVNIGAVNDYTTLRLTDGLAAFGTALPTTGSNLAPVVGKQITNLANINSKNLYIGSDAANPLQIITFTWNGSSSTSWTDPLNWTGGAGYPSAPTENAVINAGTFMPTLSSTVGVYQLTVGPAASFTMTSTGNISVYDIASIAAGTANFDPFSSFTYASSGNTQNVIDITSGYGNLNLTGTAAKFLPAVTRVKGNYTVADQPPSIGTGRFIYLPGRTIQNIGAANYYDLEVQGDRAGGSIRLGTNLPPGNTINVANTFTVAATNYTGNAAYNTFNFQYTGATPIKIPGFIYGDLKVPGTGAVAYDPLGSSDPAHVVNVVGFTPNTNYTTAGSKIKFTRSIPATFRGFQFNDLEISGVASGPGLRHTFGVVAGSDQIAITGTFVYNATGFGIDNYATFYFNGNVNQTIPSGFPFKNLWVKTGNRDVTFANSGIIDVTGSFAVSPSTNFGAGFGSITAGSTIRFSNVSELIPSRFTPKVSTGPWYNNVIISSGTKSIPSADMIIGGDLTIEGTDALPAQLTVGNNVGTRTLTVLGNLALNGTSATTAATSLIDFNAFNKKVRIFLAGNLNISNAGQLTTLVGDTTGTVLFNGVNQQYSNTSSRKNGFVKFVVGDGINPTTLTLNTNLDLIRSQPVPLSGMITVNNNATLNVGTKNIIVGTDDGNGAGRNPKFILNAGATLVTANTGGAAGSTNFAIEGAGTNGNTGSIQTSNIDKTFNNAANYVLNGATVNPFPAAITVMNKLTIGANVSLNRAIDANGTLDLASYTLTQAQKNLEFNGLTSTSGKIYADKFSSITVKGSNDTLVGPIRFVLPNGNATGLLDIDKAITVSLASDLFIVKTPLVGNLKTGTSTSILDINGNTLTIDGAFNGPGFLAGSNTSNLTLNGGAASGTLKFAAGKEVLKDLKLLNAATATLGSKLDIAAGIGPNAEGSISIPGTGVLTTGGFALTLKSDPLGTARIATGRSAGGYIVGDVTAERYLSTDRSWRLLSAPTVGQTIRQAWQENGLYPGNNFGTIITTNQPNPVSNGFDNFYTPGISLLTYNPVTDKWVGVSNTLSQLAATGANKAYMLFLRGDRTVNPGISNPPTPAIIRSKGIVFQGDLAPVTVNPGQFAAVGNNYASAIDFDLLVPAGTPNVDESFTVWDPKIPGLNGLGGWVTFARVNGWTPSNTSGSYPLPNKRIESGQAFMVHNGSTTTAGNVTFKETNKITGSNLVSRPASVKTILQTNFYAIENGTAYNIDGNTVVFSDEYSNDVDKYDACKFSNFNENLGMKRQGKSLVVEARQPVVETDTVFLDMSDVKKHAYRLEFKAQNFAANVNGYLEDNFLHTVSSISMNGTTTVDFEITDDAASASTDRFKVVFKNTDVPAAMASANEKSNGIGVEWNTYSEINIAGYELEKSVDGNNFTKVFSTTAKGQAAALYNWLDAKPVVGDNYYRIKSIGKNGKTVYSNTVKVNIVAAKTGFSVFPNPVSDGVIGLKMKNIIAGNYTVKILSSDGKLMSREVIKHAGGSASKNITSAAKLVSGTYQVEITGPDNKVDVIRILVF